MQWLHRLRSMVPRGVQSRGSRYFTNRSVFIQESSPTEVHARVQGSQLYSVNIQLDHQSIVVDCDCPYFEGRGTCKHIWATLVAAESGGHLNHIATMWQPEL